MVVNKFKEGDKVRFRNTYEQIMDGVEGVVKGHSLFLSDVIYTVECDGMTIKNMSESELEEIK